MKSSSLPKIEKLREHFPQPNLTCLDIGANCGQFFDSLKELYPQSSITMVEANPHCQLSLGREVYHCVLKRLPLKYSKDSPLGFYALVLW